MTVVVRGQREAAREAGVTRWMHVGEDAQWALEAERGVMAGLPRVRLGDGMAEAAARLRASYLDWIGRRGVAEDTFDWWSSELAAKNVYSFLFLRICALAAASEALAPQTLVVCSTQALADEVGAAARDRGLVVDVRARGRRHRAVLETSYGLSLLARRRAPRPGAGEDDVLLATWVDGRSFEGGGYRDPHFGPLPELLAGAGRSVSYLARPLPGPLGPADVARGMAEAGQRAHVPEAYLSRADELRCFRRSLRFAPAIPDGERLEGVPVAELTREFLAQQRVNHGRALSYGLLVRRMADAGVRPRTIVLGWEGHAWENALMAATAAHLPDTEVVGYDNVNFSALALSLYPAAVELGRRPLPARVVTNGRTFARQLGERGFPAERIRVGCALRHADLYARPPAEPGSEMILGAGSIDAAQTVEMVEKAHAAFGGDLVVKLHPASDAQRIRAAVRAPVTYVDEPISGLLSRSHLMLYTYSVVAYEALAAGVPPVFVRSDSFLDLDQLEPFEHLRWSGRTAEDLRHAAREIAAADLDAWRREAAVAVREALAPPSASCVDAFLA